jgi:hypothetical protein
MTDFALPDGAVGSEHLGVRVFCIAAPNPQELANRVAVVLGEHLATGDELHITYNGVQTGWQHDPGKAGWLGRPAHTDLFLEYTALVILRSCAPP